MIFLFDWKAKILVPVDLYLCSPSQPAFFLPALSFAAAPPRGLRGMRKQPDRLGLFSSHVVTCTKTPMRTQVNFFFLLSALIMVHVSCMLKNMCERFRESHVACVGARGCLLVLVWVFCSFCSCRVQGLQVRLLRT